MGPRMAGGGQWDAGWPMQCQQNSTWREIKGRNFGPWSPPLTLRLLLRFLFFLACLSRASASPVRRRFFSALCCSRLHFVVIRTQLGYRWLCSFPPQIKQTKSECFTCLFFGFPWGAFDYGAKLLMEFCCWWWNGGGGECWDRFFLFP